MSTSETDPMGAYVLLDEPAAEALDGSVRVTRKPTKGGQRIWFSCPACGTYGQASGTLDATEFVVQALSELGHPATCARGDEVQS